MISNNYKKIAIISIGNYYKIEHDCSIAIPVSLDFIPRILFITMHASSIYATINSVSNTSKWNPTYINTSNGRWGFWVASTDIKNDKITITVNGGGVENIFITEIIAIE